MIKESEKEEKTANQVLNDERRSNRKKYHLIKIF